MPASDSTTAALAKKPVLVVLHQESSSPGRIGLGLRRRGHALDIRRPCLGDPLPATLSGHAGAIVFGGPMSANDSHDFVRSEIRWLDIPLKEGKPLFGICLGAQMLAAHLGARVFRDPDGRVERGFYPIHPTQAGEPYGPWPELVHHFHSEGFDLPAGAELLARGDVFPNQAIAFGRTAFAIQFHVELTLAMVHRWTTRGHDRLSEPGAQARHHHFEHRAVHDHQTVAWLEHFLDRWLALDLPAGPEAPRTSRVLRQVSQNAMQPT